MSAKKVTKVTNADIYGVLMDLKEDMGAVKQSTALHLEGLKNHGERILVLEGASAKQKGAVKVWGMIATLAATAAGAFVPSVFKH